MHRVPAEIAEEIGVLLQHLHGAAGAGEEQAGHDSRGTASGDDEIEL